MVSIAIFVFWIAVALVVGILIGFWLYRRELKKNPAKVQKIAQEIADAGKKAQAVIDQLEIEAKRFGDKTASTVEGWKK